MKHEKERALERMTLKHKTFGKWAQGAAKSKNPLLKKALNESHQIGKELRKKMETMDVAGSDDEDEDEVPYHSHECSRRLQS